MNKLTDLCDVSPNCFSFNMEFSSGFKLKSAAIVNTESIKKCTGKRYFLRGISMTQYNMQEIEGAALSNLCTAGLQINSQIQSFFRELKKEVSFYLAALKMLKYLENKDLHTAGRSLRTTYPME
jgi:hypothetical protein